LRTVIVQVADLPGIMLGRAAGHVLWIERDAADFGWFVDSTPDADEEFGEGGTVAGRMDLLTVLAHELGHLLSFGHDSEPGNLMSETLAPGTRLLPIGTAAEIDDVFSTPDWP
jgi:matrixin